MLGEGFEFDIEIRKGAGAYICGEETAIFNSIEGFRGEPRNKPPFPVVAGLFSKPTVINNVETLVNVLRVLEGGGPAFADEGTADSTGSKLFCVSGHVAVPGVYEVPFGTTLGELLELAGGIAGGRALQTVLLGGAAGGFVGPGRARSAADHGGRAGREDDARLRRRAGDGRHGRPAADADADRGVLPERVVRPVRALPGRHRPPAGGAGADREAATPAGTRWS